MKLNIIIPTLNEAENLSRLLPYVKDNCPHNGLTQVIVVDTKDSNDNTVDICRIHDVIYLKSEFSQRAQQMNVGAQHGDSEILLFLHADVFPPNSFYKDIMLTLKNNYDFGMFSYEFNTNHVLLKFNAFATKFDTHLSGGGDQCLFIKKDTFNKFNGFDESYHIMEDFEFFRRLKSNNIPYKIVNSPAKVSARKYINNSWLRVNIVNLMAMRRFNNQCDTKSIKAFCKKWLRQ